MGATDARIDSSITHRPARQSDLKQESDLFAPSLRVNLDNNVIVWIPLAQCTPPKNTNNSAQNWCAALLNNAY